MLEALKGGAGCCVAGEAGPLLLVRVALDP